MLPRHTSWGAIGASWIMQFDVDSWGFFLIFLGIAAILALFPSFLSHFITPERIVLSSKGE